MKRFALVTFLLTFALAQVTTAQEDKPEKQRARHNAPAAKFVARNAAQTRQFAPAGHNRRAVPDLSRQSSFRAQQFQRSSNFNPDRSIRRRADRSFAPRIAAVEPTDPVVTPNISPVIAQGNNRAWSHRNGEGRNRDWRNGRDLSGNNNETGNWRNNDNVTGEQNLGNHNGNRRNVRERHQNWHDNHAGDPNFSQAHRGWHRQHQSRDWWRSHYSRFALFGGGYYYFNSGFWYPAYGYDPYFSSYSYDAPIYGYNNLDPGQVIANVQEQLQRAGYYRGELDGQFGPMTRRALLEYQQDNGLPVTGEIDEETLDSLGLQ